MDLSEFQTIAEKCYQETPPEHHDGLVSMMTAFTRGAQFSDEELERIRQWVIANHTESKCVENGKEQPITDISWAQAVVGLQQVIDRLDLALGTFFCDKQYSILTHFDEYSREKLHLDVDGIYFFIDSAQKELRRINNGVCESLLGTDEDSHLVFAEIGLEVVVSLLEVYEDMTLPEIRGFVLAIKDIRAHLYETVESLNNSIQAAA